MLLELKPQLTSTAKSFNRKALIGNNEQGETTLYSYNMKIATYKQGYVTLHTPTLLSATTLRQLKVSSSGSTNIGKRLNDVPYSYYHQEYKNGGYELVRHDYVYE